MGSPHNDETSSREGGSPVVWTVGHSNHTLDRFLELLSAHRIDVLVDVRSQPYSRFTPHFSREALHRSVTDAGLRYLFMGRELGGRPAGGFLYDEEGYVRYDAIAESPRFRAAIARVSAVLARWNAALLCAEEDPIHCHRRLLVGRVLHDRGVRVAHLRADGGVEPEDEVAARDRSPTAQLRLFDEEARPWRSTRSVSPRGRRRPSSGH